eukprot:10940488-Alexandrium_andersonii.AAC.1
MCIRDRSEEVFAPAEAGFPVTLPTFSAPATLATSPETGRGEVDDAARGASTDAAALGPADDPA